MTRTPPHDLEAERHVIGACLYRPDLIDEVALLVDPSDFYSPAHAATFAEVVRQRGAGVPVDAHSVARVPDGMPGAAVTAAIAGVPASTHAPRYAEVIAAHAARRRLIRLAGEITDAAYSETSPGDVVDTAHAGLDSIDVPAARLPADLQRLADLMNRPEAERMPWVVPGLLRRDWRVVLVAPEGAGKSLVLQAVGIAAAQGVHPFHFEPIPPMRVLFIDLENPEGRITHGAKLIDPHVRRHATHYDDDRVWIWNRQGGINLRSRADRATIEVVLAAVRPDLVCMGPAYKASVKERGEGWDESALATQRALDQLRTRYRFALLMEDHAPQSSGGVRDLRPFGSSVWLRWPEIGLKLAPDDATPPTKLKVSRWRGDRLPNAWPAELHRGTEFPWVGYWPDGIHAKEVSR